MFLCCTARLLHTAVTYIMLLCLNNGYIWSYLINMITGSKNPRWRLRKCQTRGFKTAVHKPMGDVTVATLIILYSLCSRHSCSSLVMIKSTIHCIFWVDYHIKKNKSFFIFSCYFCQTFSAYCSACSNMTDVTEHFMYLLFDDV